MNAGHVVSALESIAPPRYAEPWDRVGLQIGSATWETSTVLLTIDLTEEVLDEAIDAKAGMIVAYHPPIFEPLAALTDATVKQRIALRAAAAGIAVHSPHTALDAAPGGVNDWLAEGFGGGDVRALSSYASVPESQETKIVTFCPADAVERLRQSLAAVGAGRIGDYELCSFEVTGHGSFLGAVTTTPTVGVPGTLQRVDEVRLEMVCPRAALALAVLTIREFHPYEEPPIEIYALEPRPARGIGGGRRLVLDRKTAIKTLVGRIKKHLCVSRVRVATASDETHEVETIGVCAGAGGGSVMTAIDQGCELFLTGEMRHHDVLAARARGCTVVLAGHTNTERGYLPTLREALGKSLAGLEVIVSKRDADPLTAM